MTARTLAVVTLLVLLPAASTSGQVVEQVGSRALGMGGAFVAVADDGTATWWNPAGLAAGAFFDLAVARTSDAGWVSAAVPPLGLAYYRYRVPGRAPTENAPDDRQDGGVGVPDRAFTASQLGATVLQTLVDDLHVGATVKFVTGGSPGHVDVDVGVLRLVGPVRLGGVARNLVAPARGGAGHGRQFRAGVALDGERAGLGAWMVALDADLIAYDTPAGGRRVVAMGAERWLAAKRVGLRAGGRVDTAGRGQGAATGGVSVAMRAGLYLDAHVVVAGADDEDGWGVAARVSF